MAEPLSPHQPSSEVSTMGRKDSFSSLFGPSSSTAPAPKPVAQNVTKQKPTPKPSTSSLPPKTNPVPPDPMASLMHFGEPSTPPAAVLRGSHKPSTSLPPTYPPKSIPTDPVGSDDFMSFIATAKPSVSVPPSHPLPAVQSLSTADDLFDGLGFSSNVPPKKEVKDDFFEFPSTKNANHATNPKSTTTPVSSASPISNHPPSNTEDDILQFVSSAGKPKQASSQPPPQAIASTSGNVPTPCKDVDLLAFTSAPSITISKKAPSTKSTSATCTTVTQYKDRGNELYKTGKMEEAIEAYTQGIACGDPNPSDTSACYVNRAMCHSQHADWKAVIEDCTTAIEINPTYTKAFLRRAAAYEGMEKFKKALEDYQHVMQMEPGTKIASEGLMRCKQVIAQM